MRVGQKSVISKKFDFVNKSLFPVVELELSGRQFEVGDKANKVRISRIGQIWSVEHEQICQSTTALRC